MRNTIIKRLHKCVDKSEHKQFKVGCVILDKKGNVIAEGYNQKKTHPMQYKYAERNNREKKIYLHAEISALVKCRAEPHEIIVVRVKKDGSYGLAKPCPICMSAIMESGIKNIVYSTDEGTFEEIKV